MADATFRFDIPVQSLGSAIKALGTAANEQVLFSDDVVAGRRSTELKGEYTVIAAIKVLLKGSGLRVDRTASGVLLIRADKDPTSLKKGTVVGKDDPTTSLAPSGALRAAQAPSRAAETDTTQESSVGGTVSASSQESSQNDVAEVVVTGSRIKRPADSSNSPLATVSSDALNNTADIDLVDTLNRLPQFTSDQNLQGSNATDVSTSAAHSIGISTLSLRGLGPNRDLVLVDGQRMTPVNGDMLVDVDTIPSAMIDHVEVITGGASAVYGPDAVSGVINFVLKKNFQGFELNAQGGMTQAGDGAEFKVSALMGANFADDKGNVTIALEESSQGAAYQRNRSFYTDGWADPSVASNESIFTGAGYDPLVGNYPSQAVVNSIFADRPAGSTVPNGGPTFYFNTNGTVFSGATGFGVQGGAGAYAYNGPVNGSSVAYYNVIDRYSGGAVEQALKTNDTDFYVESPMRRYSIYETGHYDFNDDVSAFFNANYSQENLKTSTFPSSFISGWSVEVPYDAAHPVPAELAELLNSRPDPTAPWDLWLISPANGWMPPRGEYITNQLLQLTAGLSGKIPGTTDWTWTLNTSHGQSTERDVGQGYASLLRYQELIEAPNYGAGASITGNQGAPGYGFDAGTGTCTSGFYSTIFEGGSPSADCLNAIAAPLQSETTMTQNVGEFDAQGSLFKLPAGEVRASLGASYRDDHLIFQPDILQSITDFADQAVGLAPSASMDASTAVTEGYGELLVPLVSNLRIVKQLSLELGARYSSYTTSSGGVTYKILGNYQVNNWIRFRGGYNLAVRAPDLAELYLGKQETYGPDGATAYGDPCSLLATAPFGANPATNSKGAAGAAQAQAICKALMSPVGAATYYGTPQVPGAPSAAGAVYEEGNPHLNTEKAHTYTAGFVLKAPSDNPLLRTLNTSLDWYSITVDGAIEFQSVDAVSADCLTQSGPAATVAASPACQLLQRQGGDGSIGSTTIYYDNLGTIDTSGFDLEVDWTGAFSDMHLPAIPGAVNLHLSANYLDKFDTQYAAGYPVMHWAGTLGPTLTGTDPGAFRYKINTSVAYLIGPATIDLTWNYLPGIHPQTYGQPGNNVLGTPSFSILDLLGSWAFGDHLTFRAGIDNLLNTSPPITGANTGVPGVSLPTDGQGTTNASLYDALGRRFYIGVKATF
jgi:iron complex outermembrane recepter protein